MPVGSFSSPKKKYWLLNRDPYVMVDSNHYIMTWVGFHARYTLNNQGVFYFSSKLAAEFV